MAGLPVNTAVLSMTVRPKNRLRCVAIAIALLPVWLHRSRWFRRRQVRNPTALLNFTGTYAPLWVAVEENLGAKYGLDLKAIYAGRIRPQQLLATGEVPIVLATATGTITSHILGVKDHVLVATITNKVGTSIFARGDIKSVEDLKGKTIATGRPGAFLDATVRYVLRSKSI